MQAASTTLQFFAKAITVGAVFIHVVAVSVSSMSRSPEPYQLIFETHVSKTELAGSIALRCRDGDTAQELDISEISFFLNRSSVADPSLRERGDIPVVEVDRHTIEFNLTHRLEGYYTCGRRVNATHVRESLPKTFVSLQTIIPLPDPPPQTNFTAMSGDRVLLLCPIQPGALLQYYSVTWRKDNISIIDLMNLQIVRRTDSRYGIKASIFALIIQPASVQDSSKHYQCVVYVSNPLSNSQTELQLSPQRDVPLSLSVVPDSDTIENKTDPLPTHFTGEPKRLTVIISVSVTPTTVLTAVLVAIALIYLYKRISRRELVYDAPTNYKQPPLPPRVRRLDLGINDTSNTDDQSPAHIHNIICQHESSTSQLEDGVVSPDSEVTVATSYRTMPNNLPPGEDSNSNNNNTTVNDTILSQSLATNPDAAVSGRPPSPSHSVETDLPSERVDETNPLSNLEVGEAKEESTADNTNDKLRVPSPDVATNVSYQPSTNFNIESNSAYGTNVAIAPEIQTSENIAYEHSDPTM